MEANSQAKQRESLKSQIKESYGKVLYSQTTQEKHYQRLHKYNNVLYLSKIVLSGITAGSVITTIFTESKCIDIITAVISFGTFIVNTLFKEKNYVENANKHREAADLLWRVREDYVSLLTDFDYLDTDDIKEKRNYLSQRAGEIYKKAPRTNKKSYKEAQTAIQKEEEQTFSEDELDKLLPSGRRKTENK